jgi:hypothetical protein
MTKEFPQFLMGSERRSKQSIASSVKKMPKRMLMIWSRRSLPKRMLKRATRQLGSHRGIGLAVSKSLATTSTHTQGSGFRAACSCQLPASPKLHIGEEAAVTKTIPIHDQLQ